MSAKLFWHCLELSHYFLTFQHAIHSTVLDLLSSDFKQPEKLSKFIPELK